MTIKLQHLETNLHRLSFPENILNFGKSNAKLHFFGPLSRSVRTLIIKIFSSELPTHTKKIHSDRKVCNFVTFSHLSRQDLFQSVDRPFKTRGQRVQNNKWRRIHKIRFLSRMRRQNAHVLSSLLILLERFSFERRKVIGFAITMPHDWLKKLAPHFHPIRSKTKTNRNSLARVFPRFASATCNYYEF